MSSRLFETIDPKGISPKGRLDRSHLRMHEAVPCLSLLEGIHINKRYQRRIGIGKTNHQGEDECETQNDLVSNRSECLVVIDPFPLLISCGNESTLEAIDVHWCRCCLNLPDLLSLRPSMVPIEKLRQNYWVQLVLLDQPGRHRAQALGRRSERLVFVFIVHEARCVLFFTFCDSSRLCFFFYRD